MRDRDRERQERQIQRENNCPSFIWEEKKTGESGVCIKPSPTTQRDPGE